MPDVDPLLKGVMRRSYVLWQELVPPMVLLEYVSGDGREERDTTPWEGKFWIYEHVIRPAYYGIYEVNPGRVELFQHIRMGFQPVKANERGHLPIPELVVELGIWNGFFMNATLPWMRWFDDRGMPLPTGHELADEQRQAPMSNDGGPTNNADALTSKGNAPIDSPPSCANSASIRTLFEETSP